MNVHAVLPNDIDDPATPSGGNTYDRRVCDGLRALGWVVREHAVRGAWPVPSAAERGDLAGVLAAIPDGAAVLVDGLVASCVPEVLAPQAGRLALVVLVHMPLGDDAERAAFGSARALVATSEWTRARLDHPAVVAAPPGVDRALVAAGGGGLLCVAAVTPDKGHDVLAAALALADMRCTCVGALDRDPAFVAAVRERAGGRITFTGALTGRELARAYDRADLLVLPSRAETYGMVVTEALARAVPVLASGVGGVPEALGLAPDGRRPGLLVPPGDHAALATTLNRWRADPELRRYLRAAAADRRGALTDWATTARQVAGVLAEVVG